MSSKCFLRKSLTAQSSVQPTPSDSNTTALIIPRTHSFGQFAITVASSPFGPSLYRLSIACISVSARHRLPTRTFPSSVPTLVSTPGKLSAFCPEYIFYACLKPQPAHWCRTNLTHHWSWRNALRIKYPSELFLRIFWWPHIIRNHRNSFLRTN